MKFIRKLGPKTKIALATVFVLLVIARAVAPSIILKKLNTFLAEFSPVYTLHLDDFDLALWRGAYRLQGLHGKMRSDGTEFLTVDKIDVSLAWRELFSARVLTDIVVSDLRVSLSDALIKGAQASKKAPEDDAKAATDKLFPMRIERIITHGSEIEFTKFRSWPDADRLKLNGIEVHLSNFTPTEKAPFMLYTAHGTLMGSSKIKMVGRANMLSKPTKWDMDAELREFDLVAANPVLKRLLPLTFTSGHLDLYAEVLSDGGAMRGYVKPFFKKLDVIQSQENFAGIKHFAYEIVGALGNLILRKSEDKSLATKIPFRLQDGQFRVDSDEAIDKVLEHGFGGGLPPGVEEALNLQR